MQTAQFLYRPFLYLVVLLLGFNSAFALKTARVSLDSAGDEANDDSYQPSMSANGDFVVFESIATDLVTGDTNAVSDIFVHERDTGLITRVSVDDLGVEGDGGSFNTRISADGRYVVFDSDATNLVPGDTNGQRDVFVHDRDPLAAHYHPADKGAGGDEPEDWSIGDFELLSYIDDWADGEVGDFELLDAIDLWAAGEYHWDDEAQDWKPGPGSL